ncbi:dienelactone hydrolase family protein [Acidocella sp.]|uniref:dienelactone hydrolase family protein n=1 Tax=Acidocella sp. TaxID=50710 RepID=UPI002620911F|nr:dienelactone hydrolase family protein [Acidocella sp.]
MMTLTAADGHQFQTFEAGNVNAPRGLVVLQEIFGVNHHIRKVAERLAGYGYRVLAPALFDRVRPGIELGYTEADIKAGLEARAQIPLEKTLADIEATAAAFGEGKPVGVIGYCWGGTLSWEAATRTRAFKAASCWYGAGIAARKDARPNCPVQMHFGALDKSIPLSDVEAIRAAQPGVEIYVYEGADHGFGCEERASFSPRDWELAELRSLVLFAEHLR